MNSTFDHQTTPVHDLFAIVALLIYDLFELRQLSDTLAYPTVVAFFVANLLSVFSLFSLFLMLPPDRPNINKNSYKVFKVEMLLYKTKSIG